ncbi:MAG: hypothetical protein IEMM0002_1099 [bacterium]|nr:MAG: hypothetical protein IEMM0002_1099 [bacterium]
MKYILFVSLLLPASCSKMEMASVSKVPNPPNNILFRNVSVFDGRIMLRHQDVLTTGRIITSVAPTGTNPPTEDVVQIDGIGKTLLPGLIDAHIHVFSGGGAIGNRIWRIG